MKLREPALIQVPTKQRERLIAMGNTNHGIQTVSRKGFLCKRRPSDTCEREIGLGSNHLRCKVANRQLSWNRCAKPILDFCFSSFAIGTQSLWPLHNLDYQVLLSNDSRPLQSISHERASLAS